MKYRHGFSAGRQLPGAALQRAAQQGTSCGEGWVQPPGVEPPGRRGKGGDGGGCVMSWCMKS